MPPREETEVISIRLPKSMIEAIDRAVDLGIAKTRNDLIKESLEEYLKTLSFAISLRVTAKKNAKSIIDEYAFLGRALANAVSRGIGSNYMKMSEKVGVVMQDKPLEEVEEYGKFLESITKE